MDSHTQSAQFGSREVVETGRRRRWSEDEKLRIVMESLRGRRLVSATARRYGITRSMLVTWRRAFGPEQVGPEGAAPYVDPAVIVPEGGPRTGTAPTGRMEIVVRSWGRIIVDAGVDAALRALLLEVVVRR